MLTELYEVRLILETQLAGLCAERITDDEILELKNALELKCHNAGKENIKNDMIFHKLIAKFAKNELLYSMYIKVLSDKKLDIMLTDYAENSYDDEILHLKLFEAIEQRNPKRAKEISREIIEFVRNKLEQ